MKARTRRDADTREHGDGVPVRRRRTSAVLLALGALLLVVAGCIVGYAALNTWLRGQSRYLEVPGSAQIPLPTPASTAVALSAQWPETPSPCDAPPATAVPTPEAIVSQTYPPVQIRIPAIDVSRSIMELRMIQNPETGARTQDTEALFRPGRNDLVGHWAGSAYPGEAGNMILVGHNYGYGYNGVFLRLGRLKAGAEVTVVDEAGQSFAYRVTSVQRLKWQEKNLDELAEHWNYLSPDGAERLTLVTCGGAEVEPFPERIYVVAEPVP